MIPAVSEHPDAGDADCGQVTGVLRDATVLVVDPDPSTRWRLGWVLRSRGTHVLQAADAGDALLLCRHHDVDLVVSKCRLPGLSGFELYRQLHRRTGPPVMLLSEELTHSDEHLEDGLVDVVASNEPPILVVARCAAWRRSCDTNSSHRPEPAAVDGAPALARCQAADRARSTTSGPAPDSWIGELDRPGSSGDSPFVRPGECSAVTER